MQPFQITTLEATFKAFRHYKAYRLATSEELDRKAQSHFNNYLYIN